MDRKFNWLVDEYGEAGAREKFEDICTQIIQSISDDANNIKVNKGDGGIDIMDGDINSKMEVYQCKFHINGIKKSQKDQIRKSFDKIINNYKTSVIKWYLCIPCRLDTEEKKWWDKFKKDRKEKYGISVKLYDEDKLIQLLKKYELYDDVFETIRIDKKLVEKISNEKKIDKIENDFKDIIYLVEKHPLNSVPIEYIETIDQITIKYGNDRIFKKYNILSNLEQLAMGIAVNTGHTKDKEQLKKLNELATLISKDYWKIIKKLEKENKI